MELSDQVCSLEFSKRLQKLGVKQESLFYWYYAMHDGINIEWKIMYGTFGLFPDRYSAFTASELLELLPKILNIDEYYSELKLRTEHEDDKWFVTYETNYYTVFDGVDKFNEKIGVDEGICNALAKMLIHLIENGLIKL